MTPQLPAPPRIACWLLAAVLPDDVAGRSIQGDLIEEFHGRPAGWRRRIWFWRAAIGLVARYAPARPFRASTTRGRSSGHWRRDVLYAVRLLARRPLHTAVSVLGLGVGLTATVTVFSFFSAALGDPPGVVGAKTLAVARFVGVQTATGSSGRSFTPAEVAIALRGIPGLDNTAAFGTKSVTIQVGAETQSVFAKFVSATYFTALGTQPLEGRVLGTEDDRADASTVVISERLAQRLFARPREALGTVLRVADRDLLIVGVLPDRFARVFSPGLNAAPDDAVYVPLALHGGWPASDPSLGWLTLVGRLQDGFTERDVNAAVGPVAQAIETARSAPGRVTIAFDNFLFGFGPSALLTFASLCLAAPILLLAIGCANVANLRLAQATERAREIAVRHSLGATRGDIVRLLVLESALISLLAMLFAWSGTHVLLLQFAAMLPIAVPLDWSVAAFACLAAVAVTICSGLIPAWLVTGRNTERQLKQSGAGGGYARTRLRHSLVVIQIALSVTLLTIAALFVRTVQEIYGRQPAVLEQILVAQIDLANGAEPKDPGLTARFEEGLLKRLGPDPRVQGVGLLFATSLYSGGGPAYWLAGESRRDSQTTALHRVTPSWFMAMDLAPLTGRLLQSGDEPDVAVVNESLAASLGPGAPVLGATIQLSLTGDGRPPTPVTIVGVVPDSVRVINRPLRPRPILYLAPPTPMPARFTIAVRTNRVDDVLRDLPHTLSEIQPELTWRGLETADKAIARGAGPFRFFATGMAALGVVALLVAGVGLFAVTAYLVSLRTREFGVRMALGARKGDVVRLVLRQVGLVTAAGLGLGVVLTAPAANMLRFLFLGLSPTDPVAIVSIVVLLGGTTILAAILPARRAATIDPVRALRVD